MRADHQVAQKLHALTSEGSDRAHDLVDLHLLGRSEDLDLSQIKATCARLFTYRRQQSWPPVVTVGPAWDTLYDAAAEDVESLPNVEAAVAWVNDFIEAIDEAEARPNASS